MAGHRPFSELTSKMYKKESSPIRKLYLWFKYNHRTGYCSYLRVKHLLMSVWCALYSHQKDIALGCGSKGAFVICICKQCLKIIWKLDND